MGESYKLKCGKRGERYKRDEKKKEKKEGEKSECKQEEWEINMLMGSRIKKESKKEKG